MEPTSPEALAGASFAAVAAICDVLRRGEPLTWPALEDTLRRVAMGADALLADSSNRKLQDDMARLINVLLGAQQR